MYKLFLRALNYIHFFNMKAFSVSVEVLETHYVKEKGNHTKMEDKTKLCHKTIITNTLFF